MFFCYEEMVPLENEVEFTAYRQTEGYYDYENGGVWVEGDTSSISVYGVVHHLTEKELQYYEAGAYSTKDLKIYTKEDLKEGTEVEHNDSDYVLQRKKFNKTFADFGTYIAKKRVVK